MRDEDDFLTPPTRRTSEERRDAIVDARLGRGLCGLGAAVVIGAGVLLVDKPTGKWLVGCSLAVLAGSTVHITRTVGRMKRRER